MLQTGQAVVTLCLLNVKQQAWGLPAGITLLGATSFSLKFPTALLSQLGGCRFWWGYPVLSKSSLWGEDVFLNLVHQSLTHVFILWYVFPVTCSIVAIKNTQETSCSTQPWRFCLLRYGCCYSWCSSLIFVTVLKMPWQKAILGRERPILAYNSRL